MADAAVEFLLENLKQLLIHHVKLIKGAQEQVEKPEKDVGDFKLFLKKLPTKKQREDETLKALVRDIRGVVYDAVVTQAAENKTRTYFKFFNTSTNLISVAGQVNTICFRIREIYDRKDKIVNLAIADGDNEVPQKDSSKGYYFFFAEGRTYDRRGILSVKKHNPEIQKNLNAQTPSRDSLLKELFQTMDKGSITKMMSEVFGTTSAPQSTGQTSSNEDVCKEDDAMEDYQEAQDQNADAEEEYQKQIALYCGESDKMMT